jgi:hypothetical protein
VLDRSKGEAAILGRGGYWVTLSRLAALGRVVDLSEPCTYKRLDTFMAAGNVRAAFSAPLATQSRRAMQRPRRRAVWIGADSAWPVVKKPAVTSSPPRPRDGQPWKSVSPQ